jgi:hypothetical protein
MVPCTARRSRWQQSSPAMRAILLRKGLAWSTDVGAGSKAPADSAGALPSVTTRALCCSTATVSTHVASRRKLDDLDGGPALHGILQKIGSSYLTTALGCCLNTTPGAIGAGPLTSEQATALNTTPGAIGPGSLTSEQAAARRWATR